MNETINKLYTTRHVSRAATIAVFRVLERRRLSYNREDANEIAEAVANYLLELDLQGESINGS